VTRVRAYNTGLTDPDQGSEAYANRISNKLEGDYRFPAKEERSIVGETVSGVEDRSLVKARTNSYCVRLMGVYRFN